DVLGVALRWFNEVTFETDGFVRSAPSGSRLRLDVSGEGVESLPRNASNLVVRAANRVFKRARRWPSAWQVRLVNRIPLSRGLGSSAAATLGGIVAANALLGKP